MPDFEKFSRSGPSLRLRRKRQAIASQVYAVAVRTRGYPATCCLHWKCRKDPIGQGLQLRSVHESWQKITPRRQASSHDLDGAACAHTSKDRPRLYGFCSLRRCVGLIIPSVSATGPGRWSAERPPPGEPRGGFETGLRGHLGGGIPVDPEQNTDHDEVRVGTCQGNDQGDEGRLRHDISPFPIALHSSFVPKGWQ
jgi:hypothetical protein